MIEVLLKEVDKMEIKETDMKEYVNILNSGIIVETNEIKIRFKEIAKNLLLKLKG